MLLIFILEIAKLILLLLSLQLLLALFVSCVRIRLNWWWSWRLIMRFWYISSLFIEYLLITVIINHYSLFYPRVLLLLLLIIVELILILVSLLADWWALDEFLVNLLFRVVHLDYLFLRRCQSSIVFRIFFHVINFTSMNCTLPESVKLFIEVYHSILNYRQVICFMWFSWWIALWHVKNILRFRINLFFKF